VLQARSSRQQLPGRTRNDGLPIDRNWTLECTEQSLNQNGKQDNEQGPLQKPAMNEESEPLMFPQL